MDFARNLSELLEDSQYDTQEEFAVALNREYGTKYKGASISEWTSGKKMPCPIVVEQIGELFDLDAGYMLSDHLVYK